MLRLQLPDGRVFDDLSAIVRVKSEFEEKSLLLHLQFHLPTFFSLVENILRRLLIRHADILIAPLRTASDYSIACRLFVRSVGALYFLAFLSSIPQILGLVGSHGILPLSQFPYTGWTGVAADRALLGTCLLGTLLGLMLTFRIKPFLSAVALFGLYSLLITAGGEFFAFTFDYYQLEVGLIAILVAPFTGRRSRHSAPPNILVWYVWWLLFRLLLFPLLNFFSGTPIDFSSSQARFDLMCQPIPTAISWWIFQAQPWLQTSITFVTTALSIMALIALPAGKKWRPLTGVVFIATSLWGLLLGNGSLSPWLTISLSLLCFDNSRLHFFSLDNEKSSQQSIEPPVRLFRPIAIATGAAFLWLLSFLYTVDGYGCAVPPTGETLLKISSRMRLMLSHIGYARPVYNRPEIVIEGTSDGKHWRPYILGWKPVLPSQAPRFACFYHPRLDWQLWFPFTGNSSYWIGSLMFNSPNQLGRTYDWKPEPILVNFVAGLKRNQPEIIALLQSNPFPNKPPLTLRLQLYDYEFTRMKQHRKTGRWWNRKLLGTLDIEQEKLYPNLPPVKVVKKVSTEKNAAPLPTLPPSLKPAPATATKSANQTPVGGKGPVDDKTSPH